MLEGAAGRNIKQACKSAIRSVNDGDEIFRETNVLLVQKFWAQTGEAGVACISPFIGENLDPAEIVDNREVLFSLNKETSDVSEVKNMRSIPVLNVIDEALRGCYDD